MGSSARFSSRIACVPHTPVQARSGLHAQTAHCVTPRALSAPLTGVGYMAETCKLTASSPRGDSCSFIVPQDIQSYLDSISARSFNGSCRHSARALHARLTGDEVATPHSVTPLMSPRWNAWKLPARISVACKAFEPAPQIAGSPSARRPTTAGRRAPARAHPTPAS